MNAKRSRSTIMEDMEESGFTIESSTSAGMDLESILKKMQQMETELLAMKKKIKLDGGASSSTIQLALQIGERFGQMEREINNKASKEQIVELKEEIGKLRDEIKAFKEQAPKNGAKENGQMKNGNKWNKNFCGPKLEISANGLVVTHSGANNEYQSILASLPVNIGSYKKANILSYFEVEILKRPAEGSNIVNIGFCDREFPLNRWVGTVDNSNSIGICCSAGMYIDGEESHFAPVPNPSFKFDYKIGTVLGMGLKQSQLNSSLDCFLTSNGKLIGSVEIPEKFTGIELFPAATLQEGGQSIQANFGKKPFRYDLAQLN